ncbi:hypothetical protein Tco_1155466 [Tanacetum coccineum]
MAEHGDEIEPKAESFMDKVSEKIHRDDSSSSSLSDNESDKKKKQPLHKDAPVTSYGNDGTPNEPVCDSVTPSSLPQHDSSTPCKDSVCESITPSDINLSFVSQQATASQGIDDVMRQLSFDETELDGEAGFADVAGSGVDSSGLSHDESFGVDDLDLNLNEPVNLNVSQVETQSKLLVSEEPDEFSVEDVVIEDYVSSREDGEDVEQGNGQEDESAPTDGQFFYDDEGIDVAYETEYDVQSSEDAEPDVDVHLFGISMDLPFNNIGITNLVPDDVLEGEDVDVVNVDGFDSDPGNDEERNYRKRRLAELRTEMKGVINSSVHKHPATAPTPHPTDIVKELWDALERQMRGSEYDEQDRKAASLYEYETFKATEGEKLLDTYLCYLQVINDLKKYGYKKDNCDMNDASGIKKKAVVVVALDPLALVAEKTKVSKGREKVVVHSEESDDESLRRQSLSETIRFTGLGSEEGFSRAIRIYFGDNHDTFSKKLSYNIDHLQKHIEKEYLHKGESRNCFTVLKTQFETFFTLKQVDSPDHKDQVEDQILKESFQKYTGKELQTYRRELLYYMDALELHMGRRELHESECLMKA